MRYIQDVSGCIRDAGNLGDEHGLGERELALQLEALDPSMGRLRKAYHDRSLPFLRVPERREDWPLLKEAASRYRERFDDVVVFGTGGSSLGAKALHDICRESHGDLSVRPRLHVLSSVDPFRFHNLIQSVDLDRTGFIAISKSGNTAETLLQVLTILPALLERHGRSHVGEVLSVVTEPGDNPLRSMAAQYDLPVFYHDPDVGGRFAVLTTVGMLPALIAGLDGDGIREGALETLLNAMEAGRAVDCPAAYGAAVMTGLNLHRGITSSVMLTYSDRLRSFTEWYRQLWAESLGKEGKGLTPISAAGPVDQHSQLQLWLEGPCDKAFTIIGAPTGPRMDPVDTSMIDDDRLDYLNGSCLGDFMEISKQATAETLVAKGRPVRRIELDAVDEVGIGSIMMHFMLETILAADLLCVNPYDQPAVEHGKRLARAMLSGERSWRSAPAAMAAE